MLGMYFGSPTCKATTLSWLVYVWETNMRTIFLIQFEEYVIC